MNKEEIKNVIKQGVDCQKIEVIGDDGAHFEAIIVSDNFKNLNRVKRHQLVYESLGDLMDEKIHALSLKLYDTDEWEINKEK